MAGERPVNPNSRFDTVFAAATLVHPQSGAGVPWIAAETARLMVDGRFNPDALSLRDMRSDPNGRHMAGIAARAHNLFATEGNLSPGSSNLSVTLPLAYGIVS